MKRFIRYLYEYQNGKKTRNTGFVKVLEQDRGEREIQIYGRGFPVAGGRTLEIYLFYEEDGTVYWNPDGRDQRRTGGIWLQAELYERDDVGGDGQIWQDWRDAPAD